MNLYKYTIQASDISGTDFTIPITVGTKAYTFRFLWCTELQEQLEELLQRVTTLANSDPIVEGSTYNRDYDWVDYYLQFANMSSSQIQEWYNAQEYLPQSLIGKSSSVYVSLIQSRYADAYEYNREFAIKQEAFRWNVEVSLPDNDKVVTFLQPGAWIDYGTDHAFRFTCEGRANVGLTDLQYVTVEFDIDE